MRHTMTLLLASRRKNKFMESLDLRPSYKWFVEPVDVSFETNFVVDDEYFMAIIKESKNSEDYWIPAIIYMDNWYYDKGVKVLSNGEREVFPEAMDHKSK